MFQHQVLYHASLLLRSQFLAVVTASTELGCSFELIGVRHFIVLVHFGVLLVVHREVLESCITSVSILRACGNLEATALAPLLRQQMLKAGQRAAFVLLKSVGLLLLL